MNLGINQTLKELKSLHIANWARLWLLIQKRLLVKPYSYLASPEDFSKLEYYPVESHAWVCIFLLLFFFSAVYLTPVKALSLELRKYRRVSKMGIFSMLGSSQGTETVFAYWTLFSNSKKVSNLWIIQMLAKINTLDPVVMSSFSAIPT